MNKLTDARSQIDELKALAGRVGEDNPHLASVLYYLAAGVLIGIEGVIAKELQIIVPEYLNVAGVFMRAES